MTSPATRQSPFGLRYAAIFPPFLWGSAGGGWWRVVEANIAPIIEDTAFLAQASENLPAEPWDEGIWANWTKVLKEATGRKGKALFHPLRLALTGREDGPELAALLPLIGRARAAARLSGHAA